MLLRIVSSVTLLFAGPVTLCAGEGEPVILKSSAGRLELLIGKEPVARYHTGKDVAKPYFWPLNAPGEIPVTRAWPMEKPKPGDSTDHPHQKSAWFCHGDIIPEGIELKHHIKGIEGVDFWSEATGHGRILQTRYFAQAT